MSGITGLGSALSAPGVVWTRKNVPVLVDGDRLVPYEYIRSPAGTHGVLFNAWGQFVVFKGSSPTAPESVTLWFVTLTNTESPQGIATMQRDGNLVIYSHPGTAHWSSGTAGAGECFAVIQDDGNFVVYNGKGLDSRGAPVWDSKGNVPRRNSGKVGTP